MTNPNPQTRPLEPGDLCLIVGFMTNAANVGKTCTLQKMVGPEVPFVNPCDDTDVLLHIGDEPTWLVTGDGLISSCARKGYALVAPKHLMRIDPQQEQGALQRHTISQEAFA